MNLSPSLAWNFLTNRLKTHVDEMAVITGKQADATASHQGKADAVSIAEWSSGIEPQCCTCINTRGCIVFEYLQRSGIYAVKKRNSQIMAFQRAIQIRDRLPNNNFRRNNSVFPELIGKDLSGIAMMTVSGIHQGNPEPGIHIDISLHDTLLSSKIVIVAFRGVRSRRNTADQIPDAIP